MESFLSWSLKSKTKIISQIIFLIVLYLHKCPVVLWKFCILSVLVPGSQSNSFCFAHFLKHRFWTNIHISTNLKFHLHLQKVISKDYFCTPLSSLDKSRADSQYCIVASYTYHSHISHFKNLQAHIRRELLTYTNIASMHKQHSVLISD